jgi:hypothetical protein
MAQRHPSQSKDEALLVSVAESIGSTLGTLAAKASAAPEILSEMAHTVEREGNKLKRKTKSVARKITSSGARKLKRNKPAKAAKRTLRRAKSSVKRAVRRKTAKKRATGSTRRRK